MNTFIPIEALKPEPTNENAFQVEEKYKHELTAALFMYMCCDMVSTGPGPLLFKDLFKGDNPGWTARVDMMHDKCEDAEHAHEPKSDCRDDEHFVNEHMPQTGQEWLRRRYHFAIDAMEGKGKSNPKLRLTY